MTTRAPAKSRTYQDHAREAARNTPSPATIKRVTDAYYFGQDVQPIGTHEYRGWTIRLYNSFIVPGNIYVSADRVMLDGRPEALSEDFASMDEARAWARKLPPPGAVP